MGRQSYQYRIRLARDCPSTRYPCWADQPIACEVVTERAMREAVVVVAGEFDGEGKILIEQKEERGRSVKWSRMTAKEIPEFTGGGDDG